MTDDADKKFFNLTGFGPEKSKVSEEVTLAVLSRIRQTRPGLAQMLDAEKYFFVTAYDEHYGKLREIRASYAPFATVIDVIEINHPTAGPVHGIVMQPKHGFTVQQILKMRTGKDVPEEMKGD